MFLPNPMVLIPAAIRCEMVPAVNTKGFFMLHVSNTKLNPLMFLLALFLSACVKTEHIKSNKEIQSRQSKEQIMYQHCLSKFGLAWCGLKAPIDLVKRTLENECTKERENYREALILERSLEGDMSALQVEQYADGIVNFMPKWELELYAMHCL